MYKRQATRNWLIRILNKSPKKNRWVGLESPSQTKGDPINGPQ